MSKAKSEKPDPDIFLRAAERMASGYIGGCCWAIQNEARAVDFDSPENALFNSLFDWEDNRDSYRDNWPSRWDNKNKQHERVLALLFCYWESKGV